SSDVCSSDCGKDNFRKRNLLVEEFLDHTEAIKPRHLDVEENQIRVVLTDQIDRFQPILSLGHDIHIANVFEQISEFVPGELLIIHYDSGKRHSFLLEKYSRCTSIEPPSVHTAGGYTRAFMNVIFGINTVMEALK